MKAKSPNRMNFSTYGKLCDQNMYHESEPILSPPKGYESPKAKKKLNQQKNYFFKSVSRQKRGNFRFDIKATKGEFTHHPDFNYTKRNSPKWVFPKNEKYSNEKYEEYEVCSKHPIVRQDETAKMKVTESLKDIFKDRVKLSKSNSMVSTSPDLTKNYSILSARATSPSGFFNQTKIKAPRYLSKEDLKKMESDYENNNYEERLRSSQRGFVDLKRQKPRHPNVNRKSFQHFEKTYNHEKQFNNYSTTKYPLNPHYHIDFQKQQERPSFYNTDRFGPNPQTPNIDITRVNQSKVNYKLSSFRNKIQTRYDRAEPEPNTRLDIDVPEPVAPGMVEMDRDIGRCSEFFPVVDPIIKKPGDKFMKEALKKHVKNMSINPMNEPQNPENSIPSELKTGNVPFFLI